MLFAAVVESVSLEFMSLSMINLRKSGGIGSMIRHQIVTDNSAQNCAGLVFLW